MRGKRDGVTVSKSYPGITPADAGKTRTSATRAAMLRDHPRGCGENFVSAAYAVRVPGSPPRMRGKLVEITPYVAGIGITPADAGKTAERA